MYQFVSVQIMYQFVSVQIMHTKHMGSPEGGGEGGMNPPPWGTTDSKCQLESFVWGNMCNNTVVLLLNVFCICFFRMNGVHQRSLQLPINQNMFFVLE